MRTYGSAVGIVGEIFTSIFRMSIQYSRLYTRRLKSGKRDEHPH